MHEHFDESGFIHMNGRTYDPRLGRMMQADPFVQVPTNLQNYNRYSYVLNAPLAYTDPSGYKKIWNQSWFRQVAVMAVAVYSGVYVSGLYEGYAASTLAAGGTPIAIGGSVSATSGLIAGTVVGALSGNTMLGASVGCTIATAGLGTAACVAGFTAIHQASMGASGGTIVRSAMVAFVQTALLQGIGNEFGGAVNTAAEAGTLLSTPEYYAKIISHAVVGCISSAASGGECESGAISAGFGAATSPWLPNERAAGGGIDWSKAGPNLVLSGIMGGIGSELSGGSFRDGFKTAAWGYLFNQVLSAEQARRAAEARNRAVMEGSCVAGFENHCAGITAGSPEARAKARELDANIAAGADAIDKAAQVVSLGCISISSPCAIPAAAISAGAKFISTLAQPPGPRETLLGASGDIVQFRLESVLIPNYPTVFYFAGAAAITAVEGFKPFAKARDQ